jgi:hypothetical protein
MRQDSKCICGSFLTLALFTGLLFLMGCAMGVRQQPSGFLGDYAGFQPDPDQRDVLYYEKPGVDWKRFKRLQIDPILVYYKPDAKNRQIDPNTLKKMTDYFMNAVVKAVEDKYPVVSEPGPDVLRIRAAITELNTSNVMEAEFLDSETGERLGAIVHKRVGTPMDLVGGYSKWGHAKAAFDYWAKELRKGLDAPDAESKGR